MSCLKQSSPELYNSGMAATAAPAKLQVNTADVTKSISSANKEGNPPSPKAMLDTVPSHTPEASPSKKRPELRPQTKTPKHADKDKEKAKDKEALVKAPNTNQNNNLNRGNNPQRDRAKAWDAKRPAGNTQQRQPDKRDDKREERRGGRDEQQRRPVQRRDENWNGQKKDQKGMSADERALNEKPAGPVHPLQCTWMFWLSLPLGVAARNDRKNRWESTLKELGTSFNSVEHFWGYVHHMELPSRMEYNSSYYLFKSATKPMWEHEDNIGGGKWVIQLKAPNHVDDVWQNIILALVGETFDAAGDAITGAVVNRRRAGDRVAIWLRKSSEEVIADIGEKIKAVATDGLEAEVSCTFSIHNTEPPTPQAAAE